MKSGALVPGFSIDGVGAVAEAGDGAMAEATTRVISVWIRSRLIDQNSTANYVSLGAHAIGKSVRSYVANWVSS